MACCPSHDSINITRVPALAAEAASTPAWPSHFTETNIKSGLKDGYWIEAFPFRSRPDPEEGPVGPEIIAYGLGFQDDNGQPIPSDVRMHLNPYHEMKNQVCPPDEWPVTVIQQLNFPVAVTYGNFRPKSGLNDGEFTLCSQSHL
ncbi:hypothetical protein FS749_014206 [Ceratobasidium sp. UAMH 11750]|nr:hypothetical protein FS749_014206 [Ceratobasidium sp. UAMH 11750]